jgi:iron complex outermembrane receptor protein
LLSSVFPGGSVMPKTHADKNDRAAAARLNTPNREEPMKLKTALLAATVLTGATTIAFAQNPASTGAAAPVQPQTAQAQAQRGTALEEIVVTAQRKEQNLQDTPVAVTAFSGDALLQKGTVRLEQLQSSVPGMTLNTGVNNKSTLTVVLRGLGEGGGGFASAESPVSFYVDDVIQGRLSGTNTEFSDIERIEVLRGPQGTLFGRNAQSGAVNIISRSPGDDLYANASLGYGNYKTLTAKAAIGGPISGTPLSASIAGTYRNQDKGYKRNIVLNRDVDYQDFAGIRGKIRYRSDAFDATLSASYTDNEGGYEPVAIGRTTVAPLTGSYFVTQMPFESVGRTKITNVNFRFTYDLGAAQFKSISAWQKLSDAFRWDLVGGVRLANGTVVPGFDRNSRTQQQQWTQEVQLTGKSFDDKLDWIVGGFYYTENVQQRIDDTLNIPAFFLFNSRSAPTIYSSNNESYAGFVQGTYAITDQLGFTAGIRYTTEDKSLNGAKNVPFRADVSYNAWTPRFSLDYRLNDSVLLYASATRGFRAGGFQSGGGNALIISTPYQPETVWSYELGTKTDFFDNRLRVNVTGFLAAYKSLQAAVLLPGAGVNVATQNGYDADMWGVEIEAQAVIIDGVTVNLALGLQDQKFKNINPAAQIAASIRTNPGLRGSGFAGYTGTIGLNVDKPLADLGVQTPGNFLFGVDFNFRDRTFASPDNNVYSKNPVQRRLNGFIGYRTEDERWRFALSAQNITNAVDWLNGLDLVATWGQTTRSPLPPRTYMFEVSYKY